jgi:pyruvate dehydrogenase E1 component alpha subunit
MVEKVLAEFSVKYLQVLDENGKAHEDPQVADGDVRKMYETMALARALDDRLLKLQREGRCGTYASSLGQEAYQVASAMALEKSDWMFQYFRDLGAVLIQGLPPSMYVQYWMGDERSQNYPKTLNLAPIAVPVSTQIPHAVGAAFAMKLKKQKAAVMVYFGDGATSKGDFHESLNFAGVFKLPVVFVINNNQYAISVPRSRQSAAKTLAQKAIAYGFEGIQVDGNDVFGVHMACKDALKKAKEGAPSLIECYTYRMSDHTTADDSSRYRSQEELAEWRKRDPIERLRKYMEAKGLWTQSYQQRVDADVAKKVEQAVKAAESAAPPKPEEMFLSMYAKPTAALQEQMKDFQ